MLNGFYLEEKSKRIDKIIIFLALITIGLIPIISYKKNIFSISPLVLDNYYATGEKINVFNYYKSIAIYLFSGCIFSLFTYKVIFLEQQLKKSKLNIFVAIFVIAIVLSTVFSEFKGISLWGNFDRNEGALAWTCYLAVFFVLYNIQIETKYLKWFYFALYPFLIINAILGIMNIYGYNVLQNSIVQTLLGGNGSIGGVLWTTLYNPNFSSGICGTIFSLGFMYLLLEKDIKQRILILIGNILSFIIVLTSLSISGFLAIVGSLPIIFLIAWKFTDKREIALYTGITFIINSLIFIILNNKNSRVFDHILGLFVKINEISKLIIPICIVALVAILFSFKCINKKKFLNFSVIAGLILMILVYSSYSFMLYKEEKLVEQSPKGSVVRIQDIQLFQKLESMSSGRMTIWQETIRYTNDKLLVGQGFDTLPYTINHNKIEGRYTIDKPHNTLLTVIYGSGILGAIGFIGIVSYLIIKSLYNLIDNVENKFMYAELIGVIAYLIQGIVNDTFPGTSIIFWMIAGICANRINNYNIKEIENVQKVY